MLILIKNQGDIKTLYHNNKDSKMDHHQNTEKFPILLWQQVPATFLVTPATIAIIIIVRKMKEVYYYFYYYYFPLLMSQCIFLQKDFQLNFYFLPNFVFLYLLIFISFYWECLQFFLLI